MAVSRPGLVRATLGSAERGWQRLELQPHHRGPEPATPGRRPERPPLMEAAGLPSHQRPGYNLRSPRCPALSLAAPCGHGRGGQLCEGSGGGLSPPQGLGSACLQVLPQNILLNIRVRIYWNRHHNCKKQNTMRQQENKVWGGRNKRFRLPHPQKAAPSSRPAPHGRSSRVLTLKSPFSPSRWGWSPTCPALSWSAILPPFSGGFLPTPLAAWQGGPPSGLEEARQSWLLAPYFTREKHIHLGTVDTFHSNKLFF